MHTPVSSASFAFTPSSIKVLKQSSASAMAASVVFPPAQEVAPLLLHALASKYVASASPIPATVRRTGDFAIISVSIRTILGFAGRNRYFSNTPSAV